MLWRLPATQLADLIRSRKISARDAVQAALDRLDDVNGRINAVVDCSPAEALTAAGVIDAGLKDGEEAVASGSDSRVILPQHRARSAGIRRTSCRARAQATRVHRLHGLAVVGNRLGHVQRRRSTWNRRTASWSLDYHDAAQAPALAIGTPMPGSICAGPLAEGRTSMSKISVGMYTVEHEFGMSTTPDNLPSMGAEPRIM